METGNQYNRIKTVGWFKCITMLKGSIMYKIIEIAEKLEISKTAVYKKIDKYKNTALSNHIFIENRVKMIDEKGLEFLMQTMGNNIFPSKGEVNRINQNRVDKGDMVETREMGGKIDNNYVELLKQNNIDFKKDIADLKEEKKELIILLERKNNQLDNEQEKNKILLLSDGKNRRSLFWWLKK